MIPVRTLAAVGGLVLAAFTCGHADAAPKRPNVLFIIADDASCHFGAYGCRWADTPAIDALAARGVVFDDAYVPTSKCAPCRAAILTGRNPWQLEEAANHQCTFPPKFRTFTEVLADGGVACGAEGKVWGPGVAVTADGAKRTWGLAQKPFAKFLAELPPDRPFFYWHGSANPHRTYARDAGLAAGKKPSDVDRVPAYWPDDDVVRRDMLDYATEIEAFDREVGDLMAALEKSGRMENTLVVVTSDHGMPFPRVKGHTFDAAHRVPLIAAWPAGIVRPGRRTDALVGLVDLAATFLELFGIDAAGTRMAPLTGASLVDLLRDAPSRDRPFAIVGRERNDLQCRVGTESGLGYPARAVRSGDWFYVRNFEPDRWPCGDPDVALADTDASPTKQLIEDAGTASPFWQLCFGKRPADELYDLAADPDCVRNLAADPARADDVERLRAMLLSELRRQQDPRVVADGGIFDRYVSPVKRPWAGKAAANRGADSPSETIRLWANDAPAAAGTAEHDVPSVAWWPVAEASHPSAAIVVCPGGGYGGLADHEGSDYARWLNARGISAFVLRYRLGSKGYRHPVMLGDVSRAMRLVRHGATRFRIDPKRVGVMGSSAGGHLAMTLLTHGDDGDASATDPIDRVPSRADLGILCYPVVSMSRTQAHGGSRRNLLGESPSEELVADLSGELMPIERIAAMPPTFIWHTFEDKAVKLEPILQMVGRMKEAGRPCALHVYETGPHGLGLGTRPYDPAKFHPWVGECGLWLEGHGFTPSAAPQPPRH